MLIHFLQNFLKNFFLVDISIEKCIIHLMLEKIRLAFWAMFHKSGEHHFPWHKEEFICEMITEDAWNTFKQQLIDSGVVFPDQ